MRIPGMKRLKLLARWVRSRIVNGALILGYHRVVEAGQDPYAITVTPRNFAEQLEALRQYANPMPLQELAQMLEHGSLPRRAVVVTFDDGYADNLHYAKPLLERYQIPATVFVATGHIGREFWWDKLERILLSPVELPQQFSLSINGRIYEWKLPDAVALPLKNGGAGPRQRLLLAVHKLLMPLSPVERQKAMAELQNWAGFGSDNRPIHRSLTHHELIELTASGLVAVGAHTVSHPILPQLPSSVQRSEILQSKARLEALLGQPVTSFAYPNGSSSSETLAIVRESGFGCACASYNDVVWRRTDSFYLPRFWPPNWDGATLSRWLTWWLGA